MRVTAPGPSEARRLMDSGPSGYGDGKGFAQAATEMLVENAPGADIATAVRDSYTLGKAIGPALRDGRYAEAMQSFMESTAAALSALPMVPAMAGVIKAYHGTPHQFEQFSMDKIGTGEGAQAYGHGLYFAENEGTARSYRDALSQDRSGTVFEIDGMEFSSFAAAEKAKKAFGSKNEVKLIERKAEGALYHVDLDVDHDELLDWDLPLSQQPAKVQEALKKLPPAAWGDIADRGEHFGRNAPSSIADADYTGGELYRMLVKTNDEPGSLRYPDDWKARSGDEAVTGWMKHAGIPGVRYLDAGSRADGDGSRNIVMFSDDKIKIEKRQ